MRVLYIAIPAFSKTIIGWHFRSSACEQQIVRQTPATQASSSPTMPWTSASTTPALKRFKFLSEKVQQSGSADNQSHSSTYATLQAHQYLHELPVSLPEENVITFWSRRQAAYPLLASLAQDLVAAPASRAYVERVFSVCGWLTADHRNRLSKHLEMRVFLKLNRDLVWLCEWVDRRLVDACLC